MQRLDVVLAQRTARGGELFDLLKRRVVAQHFLFVALASWEMPALLDDFTNLLLAQPLTQGGETSLPGRAHLTFCGGLS
ncbi:MAG: hypothetical protein KIT22_10740 [Verrucomicrobiae bacterium]|nr:hypothetical protein [Verrucomicrobiae bacterium]